MPRWKPPPKPTPEQLAYALYAGAGTGPLELARDRGTLSVQLPTGEALAIDLALVAGLHGGAKARALSAIRDIEQLVLRNPLLSYRPASCHRHGREEACTVACKHAAFHTSIGHPLRAFFGGNRAAKTTTALIDDIIQMCPLDLLPPGLHAYKRWECPFYCRVMTPDMQRTMVPVIYEKLRQWLPKDLLKSGSFDRAFDKQGASLRLECGCRFDFLSYEMDVDKFGGTALHRCHYDETPPKSIRKECLLRLVDYGGDELFSLTPLGPLGFTFREIWKKREDAHIFAIKVGIDDNPTLDAGAREYVANVLSADEGEAAARLHGDFIHESGLVYPGWRSALTTPWSEDRLRRAEHVVGLDPGIRYAGITFTAFDDANAAHTWAALKLKNAIAEDYATVIKQTLAEYGLRLDDVEVVADPAAVARGAATGENVMDELGRYDIFAAKADNRVEVGVKGIRRRLRNDQLSIADPDQGGETQALVDELEEYALDIDPDNDDGEFRVIKADDHCCDAWRYAHQHRPWLPERVYGPEPEAGRPWWERDDPRVHAARLRHVREGEAGSVMGSMA